MKVKVPLTADADGFLTQDCPHCQRRFKAAFGKGGGMVLRHCPYCGAEGHNSCYTLEQIRYMESVAANQPVAMPVESTAAMPVHTFKCHRKRIKYDPAAGVKPGKLRCIVCGKRSPGGGGPPPGKKATARKKPSTGKARS
jgi:hypothetical protein